MVTVQLDIYIKYIIYIERNLYVEMSTKNFSIIFSSLTVNKNVQRGVGVYFGTILHR